LAALLVLGTGVALSQDTPQTAGFMTLLTWNNQGAAPESGRLLVSIDGPLTDAVLDELRTYGKIHEVIPRYGLVAITPPGKRERADLAQRRFVKLVESDQPRYLAQGAASWDRDILDVHDVEENGSVGAPDAREVAQTGAGVHVAVIDTGLVKNWRDFLLDTRVRADLARAFMGGGATAENFVPGPDAHVANPPNLWERDTSSHGTAVASHIIGFQIGARVVEGVAPDAKIIPLKVFPNGEAFTWSSHIIAAIEYVVSLKSSSAIGPAVINLSLGGGVPVFAERAAIQDAIAHGVIVVASAGNEGEAGMGWPGAFPEVISAGATGWTRQFAPLTPGGAPNFAFWWTRDVGNDPDGSGMSEAAESFVAGFSSRAIPARSVPFGVPAQQLDVLAPGNWTVAPGGHQGTSAFFFWSGTSFSSPLTAGVAALLLEKNTSLNQAQVEAILKATALPLPAVGARVGVIEINGVIVTFAWDTNCAGRPCDAVGAGLLQADAALAATP
jgi:subtilisin family serine protease